MQGRTCRNRHLQGLGVRVWRFGFSTWKMKKQMKNMKILHTNVKLKIMNIGTCLLADRSISTGETFRGCRLTIRHHAKKQCRLLQLEPRRDARLKAGSCKGSIHPQGGYNERSRGVITLATETTQSALGWRRHDQPPADSFSFGDERWLRSHHAKALEQENTRRERRPVDAASMPRAGVRRQGLTTTGAVIADATLVHCGERRRGGRCEGRNDVHTPRRRRA